MRTAIFIGLIMIALSIRTISDKPFNNEQLGFIAFFLGVFIVMDVFVELVKGNKR